MLIGKFKSNNPLLNIILFLLAILFWIDSFIYFSEVELSGQHQAPLYTFIYRLFSQYPFWNVLLSFFFMLLQAFMFNRVITNKNLVDRNSYLPALVFIVLMSSGFKLVGLQPFWFSNFFLIIALDKIFDDFDEQDTYKEIFNVGLLIGVASLFYYPVLGFFVLIWISLIIYYLVNIKSLLASLMGLVLPYLFVATYYFWFDKLGVEFREWWSFFQSLFDNPLLLTTFQWVTFSVVGVTTLIALVVVYGSGLRDKPVRLRKRHRVLLYFFLISLVLMVIYFEDLYVNRGIAGLSLAGVLAVFFQENKKNLWSEFLFTALLILVLVGKLLQL
ncbi:MAG: hypothetical protein ACLFQS_10735 [Bacteroidales bacterium]